MKQTERGFTLIELLVATTIIAILASVGYASFRESAEISRDADRKADLRELQAAVELYKNENGRYPEGCNGPGVWSGQVDSFHACASGNQYIIGIAPKYITAMPKDPAALPVADAGYMYTVNSDGSVYKLIVKNTVETEVVDMNHELRSCDITNNSSGACDALYGASGFSQPNATPSWCDRNGDQFQTSYGVWGGYATPPVAPGNAFYDQWVDKLTEQIVCSIQ